MEPKLQFMDQDKVAKMYSDLRRESMATGRFVIWRQTQIRITKNASSFAVCRSPFATSRA